MITSEFFNEIGCDTIRSTQLEKLLVISALETSR